MLQSHSKRNHSDSRTAVKVILICLWSFIDHYGVVSGQDDQCTFDLSRNLSSPFYGTVVKPSFSGISSLERTCEWFLDTEANRTFVLRVDSVRFVNRSSLTIIIDDNVTELTEDCFDGNCLRSDIYGHSLRIIWNESPPSSTFSNDNQTSDDKNSDRTSSSLSHFPFSSFNTKNKTSPAFTIRYVVVDSARCQVPDDVENAYVDHDGSIAVGESIRYRCIPYHSTKDGNRIVDVKCVLKFDLSLEPSWNKPFPVCHRERCRKNKEVSIVRLDKDRSLVIAYDGRPNRDETCRWEVESVGGRMIHVQLDWFDLPELTLGTFPTLEFYDGDLRETRLLLRLNKGTGSFGFVSFHSKVAVVLKGDGSKGAKNDTYEFYVKFTSRSSRCGVPMVPKNGDVRGSEVGSDLEDIAVVYVCDEGRHLVGSNRSECLDSGSWSSPPPICESEVILRKETASDFVDSGKSVAKVPQIRPKKIHPQSTEEKNGRKIGFIGKEDLKPQPEAPIVMTATEPTAIGTRDEEPSFSGEPDTNFRIEGDAKDYEDALSGFSELDEYSDEDVALLEGDGTISDGGGGGLDGPSGFPVVAIAIAITLPLLACTVIAVSCIVYRKLYPVRMFPGRKFETFENPIYGSNKRSNSSVETSAALLPAASGLAQSPAELQRLTIHASP